MFVFFFHCTTFCRLFVCRNPCLSKCFLVLFKLVTRRIEFNIVTPAFGKYVTRWVALVSVCVVATQRISLSVLARNPHKGPERETGSGGGKEGPRDDRESQLTKEGRREQSA